MSTPALPFTHQRIVIKLGTSVLTAGSPRINQPRLLDIVRQCARLQAAGVEVVVVSLGAISRRATSGWAFASCRAPSRPSRCWRRLARAG